MAKFDLQQSISSDGLTSVDSSVRDPLVTRSNTANIISDDHITGSRTSYNTRPQNVDSSMMKSTGTLSTETASTYRATNNNYVTHSSLSSSESNNTSTDGVSFSTEPVVTESVVTSVSASTNISGSGDFRATEVSSVPYLNSTYDETTHTTPSTIHSSSLPSSLSLTSKTTIAANILVSATQSFDHETTEPKPSFSDEGTVSTTPAVELTIHTISSSANLKSTTNTVYLTESFTKSEVATSFDSTESEQTKTRNEAGRSSSKDTTTLFTPLNTETVAISNDTVLKHTTSSVSGFQNRTSSYLSRTTVPKETAISSSEVSVAMAATTNNPIELLYSYGTTKFFKFLSDFTTDKAATSTVVGNISSNNEIGVHVTTVSPTDRFSATKNEHEYMATSDKTSSFSSLLNEMKTKETTLTSPLIGGYSSSDRQDTGIDQNQTTEHSAVTQFTQSIHLDDISTLMDQVSTSNPPTSAQNTGMLHTPEVSRSTYSSNGSVSQFSNSSEQSVTHPVYVTLTASDYPVSSDKMLYDTQSVTDTAGSTINVVNATSTVKWTHTVNRDVEYSSRKNDTTTFSTLLSTDRTSETVAFSDGMALKQTTSSVSSFQDSTSSYFSKSIVPNKTASSNSLLDIDSTLVVITGTETTPGYSTAESKDPNNITTHTVLSSSDRYFPLQTTTLDNSIQYAQSSVSSENTSEALETVDYNYTQPTELSNYFITSGVTTEDSLNVHSWSSTAVRDTTAPDNPAAAANTTSTPALSDVSSRRHTVDTTYHTGSNARSISQTDVTVSYTSFNSSVRSYNTSTLPVSSNPAIQVDASTSQDIASLPYGYTSVVSVGLHPSDAGTTSDGSSLLTDHLSTTSADFTENTKTQRTSYQTDNSTQMSITVAMTSILSTMKTETMRTITEEISSPTAISPNSVSAAVKSNLSTDHAKVTSYSTGRLLTSDNSNEVMYSVTSDITTSYGKSYSTASLLSTKMASSTNTELRGEKTTEGATEMKSSSIVSRKPFVTLPDRSTTHNNISLDADLTASQPSSTIYSSLPGIHAHQL